MLYDPTEGEILLNDENIKKFRLSSYRNLFGSVFQDYRLFALTLKTSLYLLSIRHPKDLTRLICSFVNVLFAIFKSP